MTDAALFTEILFWLTELKTTFLCDMTTEDEARLVKLIEDVEKRVEGLE